MANYNLQDPTDLEIMRANFDDYSEEDWEEYIILAKEKDIGYKKIGVLQRALKDGWSKKFSDKQRLFALSIVEELEELKEDDLKDQESKKFISSNDFEMPASHITLRVAWHDNKWNGTICNDPLNNTYCSGFNSLLSERIRKRKDQNIDKEIFNKGKSLSEIDYVPPCFWSTNLFGNEKVKIKHDNPAANTLNVIEEDLPAQSILSWPFAVSFTRTEKERIESGAYPKNLEEVRVPRFNAKIHENKSIAFMYAKFSNPLTEEEQQYLVIGAGIVNSKQKSTDIPHFGPPSEIEKIKQRPRSNYKYRNFPSMNWAMRFSFDEYSTIRMPYHEYLEEADKLGDTEDKDGFLENIKVAISEPELEWCFKYVAMDIGDDEAIYILTKMRKALMTCRNDGVVPVADMQKRIDQVEGLLEVAWSSRSYFPGFVNLSRVLLNQINEPKFLLEEFYDDFKLDAQNIDEKLIKILKEPKNSGLTSKYISEIKDLKDRLDQNGFSIEQFLQLSMLNLKPFQFKRIVDGRLKLAGDWIRKFDETIPISHDIQGIIENPYLLYEDYEYWTDSHDDVYGEELDAPIDIFKIDIAYFPHTKFQPRIDLQRPMGFIDKRRIRSLIIRHLKTLENTGDCFADADILQNVMAQYPLYYEIGEDYNIPSKFFYPLKTDYANHFLEDPKKLVLVEENDTMYYYLSEVYNAEKNLEQKFLELFRGPDNDEIYPYVESHLSISIEQLEKRIGSQFEKDIFCAEREFLYKNLFTKKLFVVSGSAGSGKSFEILKILSHLEQEANQKYLLLAPTGKAALRLGSEKEFPHIKASTIDKFIADFTYKKISIAAIREYQNVIIDETSMVDLLKFEKLLNIFNFKESKFKRLILIGDPNQLPAIGYGRVLSDLIGFMKSNHDYHKNFIQLETNCRSELKENQVLQLAEAFKQKGELEPKLGERFNQKIEQISEGFRTRYWKTKDELYEQLTEEFKKLSEQEGYVSDLSSSLNQILGLTKEGNIDPSKAELGIENFQIITPYQAQFSGANKINDYIQIFFKKSSPFELRSNLYKKNDKLIRTKNYYQNKKLLLSNGTLGFINGNPYKEKFCFEDKDGLTEIPFSDIRKAEQEFFELAYAVTVHKAQGSGFNHLFVVIPARYGLLSKELIYTALTRTKKSITLFLETLPEHSKNILEIGSERSFSASRRTSLLLEKPFKYYDLEPEKGVFVESRAELLIYHLLMSKRDELGKEVFDFAYEQKPIVNGEEVNVKTDFTIYTQTKTWYWEHLGLLGQRKYTWIWQNVKKKTYKEVGIWSNIITTDESNGINPKKIEELIDIIIDGEVSTEDKYHKYSEHHYYLR